METFGYVLIGLLGLAIGSFLNVVVQRVPRGQSVVRPPSQCPGCGHRIRERHNVPLIGWIALRGRCHDCRQPISVRYPLVEAGTAVLFVVVAVRLAALGSWPAVPAYLWFTAAAVALALIDIDHHRLPDAIVLPGYPVVAVLLTAASWYDGDWTALGRAAAAAAALGAFYLLISLVHPAGMGRGDVKLSGIVGGMLGYLSWGSLLIGAFAGFALGAVLGTVLIALGRAGRRTALPFGPFMLAGALVGILVGLELGGLYADLTGL